MNEETRLQFCIGQRYALELDPGEATSIEKVVEAISRQYQSKTHMLIAILKGRGTVFEYLSRKFKEKSEPEITEVLNRVRITTNPNISTLSLGSRIRLGLACAVLGGAEVILCLCPSTDLLDLISTFSFLSVVVMTEEKQVAGTCTHILKCSIRKQSLKIVPKKYLNSSARGVASSALIKGCACADEKRALREQLETQQQHFSAQYQAIVQDNFRLQAERNMAIEQLNRQNQQHEQIQQAACSATKKVAEYEQYLQQLQVQHTTTLTENQRLKQKGLSGAYATALTELEQLQQKNNDLQRKVDLLSTEVFELRGGSSNQNSEFGTVEEVKNSFVFLNTQLITDFLSDFAPEIPLNPPAAAYSALVEYVVTNLVGQITGIVAEQRNQYFAHISPPISPKLQLELIEHLQRNYKRIMDLSKCPPRISSEWEGIPSFSKKADALRKKIHEFLWQLTLSPQLQFDTSASDPHAYIRAISYQTQPRIAFYPLLFEGSPYAPGYTY